MSRRSGNGRGGNRHGTKKFLKEKGIDSIKGYDPPIAETGLSVYRRIDETSGFSDVLRMYGRLCANMAHRQRGLEDQQPTALSQLALMDVFINKVGFGGITVSEASDSVYNGVRSLRRPLTSVGLGKVGTFGGRETPVLTIGISFHEDEWSALNDEREEIIASLEGLEGVDPSFDFHWLPRRIPHISLGKIGVSDLTTFRQNVRPRIYEALPETVRLEKAIIHNPARKSF